MYSPSPSPFTIGIIPSCSHTPPMHPSRELRRPLRIRPLSHDEDATPYMGRYSSVEAVAGFPQTTTLTHTHTPQRHGHAIHPAVQPKGRAPRFGTWCLTWWPD
ncbi:hypothetical protein VDGL01_02571 [Verticillium dahliae]